MITIFYTKYSKTFTEYRNLFYLKQKNSFFEKKNVPVNIADILTHPLALAVWYLDDGTKRNDTKSYRIATQSFSENENKLLQQCLKQNFNVNAKIESFGKSKNNISYYSLAILRKDYSIFRDTIFDIVQTEIPSMLYKL